jgi:phosphoribosylaminoimidazole carboxylase PurE protein
MIILGTEKSTTPLVAILMGSSSDADTMEPARQILKEFDVPCEVKVLSAHRTPEQTIEFAKGAKGRGIKVMIAGAGGAAHLAGVIASVTTLPVIGVPIKSKTLSGFDSLLSMVQMPAGIPVATVAIDGASNAGLLALEILALSNPGLTAQLESYRLKMQEKVLKSSV